MQPASAILRGISSKHKLHFLKFCKETIANCNKHQIAEQIDTLMQKQYLAEEDLLKLEQIDSKITQILVSADCCCQPLSSTLWSPAIQKAYLHHHYWSLKLTAFCTQKDFKTAIQAIASWLDLEDTQQHLGQSLSSHLQRAQKQLREA